MEFIYIIAKLVYTILQFSNIVFSVILIGTGVLLFRYIRQVLRGFDRYIHIMVALHIVASILVLSVYELQSAETVFRTKPFEGFTIQLSIFTLLTINSLFQMGIYKFFTDSHCDVCLIQNILHIIHRRNECSVSPAAANGDNFQAKG